MATVRTDHYDPAADGTAGSLQERIWEKCEQDPGDYREEVARLTGLRAVGADELAALRPRFDALSFAEASARVCLFAVDASGKHLLVLADPFDPYQRSWALQRFGEPFSFAFCVPSDLLAYMALHEAEHRALEPVSATQLSDRVADGGLEISLATLAHDTHPVIRLVNSSLYDALKARASDIHIESTATGLVIKYRIDGVLLATGGASGVEMAEQVLSRLKVMADLDIGERRIPQDGRFRAVINQRDIDFRVSIMPSVHGGEDAVLRVLDKQRGEKSAEPLRLDRLGHEPDTVRAIRAVAGEPYGLILVTGPTGSGKSTTLYATLTEINTGEEKIITIEDPVEYELPGILQIPINDKKGLTFARGLRSILRHDPDKILVGEIRDGETAGIAVQAALTGHLVLTSVHANNVFSVLDRFLHMGVDLHSFVDALLGVVAQRLMRKNCPHCTRDDVPDAELIAASGLTPAAVKGWLFRKGAGCEQCRMTGYLGRQPIAEVLRFNDVLKQCFVERRPITELKQLALANGYVSIRQMALRAVADGRTTLTEVNRVTMAE